MPEGLYNFRTIICRGCKSRVRKRMPRGRRYCSHKCYLRFISEDWREKRKICCSFCKAIVYKKQALSALKAYKNLFCNAICANKYQARNQRFFPCKICQKNVLGHNRKDSKRYPSKYCSKKCEFQDEEKRARHVQSLVKHFAERNRPTSLEIKGRALLGQLGFKINDDFFEQVPIKSKFFVDVLFPDKSLVIEWDGDYWHGNPRLYKPLRPEQERAHSCDRARDAYLKGRGYNVVRFWEYDVNHKPEKVKNLIRSLGTTK